MKNSVYKEPGFWWHILKKIPIIALALLVILAIIAGIGFVLYAVINTAGGTWILLTLALGIAARVFKIAVFDDWVIEYRAKQEFTEQGKTDYVDLPFLDKRDISHIKIGDEDYEN